MRRLPHTGPAAAERYMSAILDGMSEGMLIVAADGRVLEANAAAAAILGVTVEQLLAGALFDTGWQAMDADGTSMASEAVRTAVAQSARQPVRERVFGIRREGSTERWIRLNSQPMVEARTGAPEAIVVTFIDVTEQRRLVAELHASRTDLQAILDNVPARISSWNADMTNRFMNCAAAAQFGISAQQAVGRTARDIVGADRDAEAAPYVQSALAGRRRTRAAEDRQADGSVRYSRVTYAPRFDEGRVAGYHVLGTDVTELHLSYERIRNLAQRVETSREQERRSIARMLHEGIAQELAAVRLHLEALRSQTHDERDVARLCDNLNHALQNCMEELRRGADELRPAMLGHLRLADALRAHARGSAALSRLRVEVAEVPTFPSVDESTRVLFFRAAEEALTNVASYAAAKRVDIMLHADADRLFMDVRDDGIGIPEGAMDRPGSFGLLGIRERFAARGGTMSICSTAPTGTRLSVSLPLSAVQ